MRDKCCGNCKYMENQDLDGFAWCERTTTETHCALSCDCYESMNGFTPDNVEKLNNMESVIKWHTGEPKETGEYLVTTLDGIVDYDVVYINNEGKMRFGNFYKVFAWCKLGDIAPCNEEDDGISPF